jgi:uncharacterized protein YbbC (DUF1343 family)
MPGPLYPLLSHTHRALRPAADAIVSLRAAAGGSRAVRPAPRAAGRSAPAGAILRFPRARVAPPPRLLLTFAVLALGLFGCSASQPPAAAPRAIFVPPQALTAPRETRTTPIMLGIDVLEADGFAAVKGKRIGLLTHPAGVNRHGVSTIEVLRRAPGVKLVALYAVEHGLYNEYPAEKYFPDAIDPRTGLMVYSLYNGKSRNFRATPAQLKTIDALVVDLQDIGTRSYTFSGAMKSAMEFCFENDKELIVLDRPNPLGGLKVGGPPLDAALMTDVGRFRVPYVHGLTIGELAHLARNTVAPGGIAVSEGARARGRLTVIPMRGWTRSMRWPETGLTFVPTSTRIRDWAAVQGYPMTGLGCILGGFSHGVGNQHDFRGVAHPRIPVDVLEKELRALNLRGVQFRKISVPHARTGQPAIGIYIEITDYDEWQPCDLNFWLMKLAGKYAPINPFGFPTDAKRREFLIHVGSQAFFDDLRAKGARLDVDGWLRAWRDHARVYQEQSKRYWLYR